MRIDRDSERDREDHDFIYLDDEYSSCITFE